MKLLLQLLEHALVLLLRLCDRGHLSAQSLQLFPLGHLLWQEALELCHRDIVVPDGIVEVPRWRMHTCLCARILPAHVESCRRTSSPDHDGGSSRVQPGRGSGYVQVRTSDELYTERTYVVTVGREVARYPCS